jgi:hypothetical protein
MKLYYNNLDFPPKNISMRKSYMVKFHEFRIYLKKTQMKYLFMLHNFKKYLLEINYDDFKNFIKECLILNAGIKELNDFELEIIQLIHRYGNTNDLNFKILLAKKIGSLMLYNADHLNFSYLKNLENYFNNYSKDLDPIATLNNYIRYLIIISNNLLVVKELELSDEPEKVDILDFVFDYYCD